MLEFGLSSEEFRSQYLEQQPYVHKAALAERPIQWADIDALLHVVESDDSALQLFNNGQLPPQSYSEESFELGRSRRRLNKHRFYGLLQSGATLVVNRVENYSLAAKRLCAEVARFTAQQTTSNAYMSFGGSGTFGKHWDTHDVFAIQLQGKKRWQVFTPTFPLPLSHQTSEQLRQECSFSPVLDCVLDTGDMLYIPRGWWHNVIPFDTSSLHLSVGVYVPTLSDYIMWVCSRQLPRQPKARGGLIDDEASITNLSEVLHSIFQAALGRQNLDEFKNDLQTRERLSAEFNTALFLDKSGGGLQDDDCLMLASYHQVNRESTEVRINGGRMKLEPVSRAITSLLGGVISLTLAELCVRLPHIPQSAIRVAVLELASHEVIDIKRHRV